jgi:hypothetical protein
LIVGHLSMLDPPATELHRIEIPSATPRGLSLLGS